MTAKVHLWDKPTLGAECGATDAENVVGMSLLKEVNCPECLSRLDAVPASKPDADEVIRELEQALKAVAQRMNDGEPCWCDVPRGHLILRHEGWCKLARTTLARAEAYRWCKLARTILARAEAYRKEKERG